MTVIAKYCYLAHRENRDAQYLSGGGPGPLCRTRCRGRRLRKRQRLLRRVGATTSAGAGGRRCGSAQGKHGQGAVRPCAHRSHCGGLPPSTTGPAPRTLGAEAVRVVFDTNVVVAGAGIRTTIRFWRLPSRLEPRSSSVWMRICSPWRNRSASRSSRHANSWVGCSGPSDPPECARCAAQPEASSYLRFACGLLLLETGDPRIVGQRGQGLFAAVQTMVQELVNHKTRLRLAGAVRGPRTLSRRKVSDTRVIGSPRQSEQPHGRTVR